MDDKDPSTWPFFHCFFGKKSRERDQKQRSFKKLRKEGRREGRREREILGPLCDTSYVLVVITELFVCPKRRWEAMPLDRWLPVW